MYFILFFSIHYNLFLFEVTGRARLVRTWLTRSSTEFEVSVKSLPDSYHFMFKMHG